MSSLPVPHTRTDRKTLRKASTPSCTMSHKTPYAARKYSYDISVNTTQNHADIATSVCKTNRNSPTAARLLPSDTRSLKSLRTRNHILQEPWLTKSRNTTAGSSMKRCVSCLTTETSHFKENTSVQTNHKFRTYFTLPVRF